MNNGDVAGRLEESVVKGPAYEYVPGTIPDDYQIQVARELGCSDEQVGAMLDGGMSKRDYANLVPAADMLRAMESRYGVDFRAEWVNSGSSWSLGCVAVEGPHAGESFEAEALQNDDGSIELYDDYYLAHRSAECEATVGAVVGRAMETTSVADSKYALKVSLFQKVSQSVPLDAPLADASDPFYFNCYLLFYGEDGPNESQGNELVDALVGQFKDEGMRVSLYLAYYPDCSSPEDALMSLSEVNSAWHVTRGM